MLFTFFCFRKFTRNFIRDVNPDIKLQINFHYPSSLAKRLKFLSSEKFIEYHTNGLTNSGGHIKVLRLLTLTLVYVCAMDMITIFYQLKKNEYVLFSLGIKFGL